MRARRSITAGLLTAAAFSSTTAGFAIMGSLDKASASSPVSPPVSQPQNPGQNGQNPPQNGQNPQQNGQNKLSLADLAGSVVGTGSGINVSVTNLDGNAAGAPGTETFQTNVGLQSTTIISCPSSPFNLCALGTVSGTFTITTSVGTLSGTAAGEVEAPLISDLPRPVFGPAAEGLGLTVISATGEFKGTTGTLTLEIPTLGSSVEGGVFG